MQNGTICILVVKATNYSCEKFDNEVFHLFALASGIYKMKQLFKA